MAGCLYYELEVVEREAGLALLCESYLKAEARREIADAISEARGDKKLTSLDRWVEKMLYEQRRMKYGRDDKRKGGYERDWRRV